MIKFTTNIFALVWLGLVVGASQNGYAQASKFGTITAADFADPRLTRDSLASAVVISDVSKYTFELDNIHYTVNVKQTRTCRIKILKDGAIPQWGTVRRNAFRGVSITDISANSYNLLPDGKIETSTLNRKDIFYGVADKKGVQAVRFTVPNIRTGSIIEYKYTIFLQNGFTLPRWQFQYNEPVLYSELVTEIPEQVVSIANIIKGYIIPEVKRGGNYNLTETKYVMRNIPALREEPLIDNIDNYRAEILFNIKSIGLTPFILGWKKEAEKLMENERVGKQIEQRKKYTELSGQICKDLKDNNEKVKAIYEYVRKNYSWNKSDGYYAEEDLTDLMTTKTGNSAEINLLLINLLKAAGFEANPALISTRDNGYVRMDVQMINQFNQLIAEVILPEQVVYLDATEPLLDYPFLPKEDLNQNVLPLHNTKAFLDTLPKPPASSEILIFNAKIDGGGKLSGSLSGQFKGYTALDLRKSYPTMEKNDWVKSHILNVKSDITFDSLTVEGETDGQKRLAIKTLFTLNGNGVAGGEDEIYLNSSIAKQIDKNPFTKNERIYPIDFGYPSKTIQTLNLEIPQGYTVAELPKSVVLKYNEGSIVYKRLAATNGKMLFVTHQLTIDKSAFPAREYAEMKKFFAEMIRTKNEQIVLKKN